VGQNLATNYSDDERDLANIESYPKFLEELGNIFFECYRVLNDRHYIAIIVGDFRHKNKYIPYHADIIELLTKKRENGQSFYLQGITILVQNAKRLYPYGYPYAYVPNVHNQYIIILRKSDEAVPQNKKKGRRKDTSG